MALKSGPTPELDWPCPAPAVVAAFEGSVAGLFGLVLDYYMPSLPVLVEDFSDSFFCSSFAPSPSVALPSAMPVFALSS